MDAFFAWVEESAAYTVLRVWNQKLWRLWTASLVGSALRRSLREVWQTSAIGRTFKVAAGWVRSSLIGSLLVEAMVARPSAVANWLRRMIGDEHVLGPATRVESMLLYFLVLFVPVELWLITFLPPATKYFGDLGLVVLLLMGLARLQQAGWPLRRTPADLPIAVLLAAGILSTVWNAVPLHIAAFGMRAYLEYYALYFAILYLPLVDRQRRSLVLWLLAVGVAIALFGDVQKFLHIATPRQWLSTIEAATTRAFGTMGNPNTFGAFLVWLLSLLMALLVLPVRGALRLLAIFGMAIAGPALLFTLSREALIAAGAALLFIAVLADRRLLLLAIPGIFAVLLLDPHIVARFAVLLSGSYIHVSSSYGRLLFWERGLQAFLANPWLGWGPGRFGGSVAHIFGSPVYHLYRLGDAPVIDSQHVQTLVELGMIGYFAYIWLAVAAIVTGMRLFKQDRDPFWRAIGLALAAGTIGLYVQSLFASLLETHQVILVFWLIFGLAAYRLRMWDRRAPRDQYTHADDGDAVSGA